MEKANKFFFLASVNDNVNCDFRRDGDKTLLTFCHGDDKQNQDRLNIGIRTESNIDHTTGAPEKAHYVSYSLDSKTGNIQNAESSQILAGEMVWGFVVAIVNDCYFIGQYEDGRYYGVLSNKVKSRSSAAQLRHPDFLEQKGLKVIKVMKRKKG